MRKIIWQRLWARRYAPLIAEAWVRVFTKRRGYRNCRSKLFVPEGRLSAIYFSEDEFRQVVRRYTRFLLRANLRRYAVEYERVFRGYLRWARSFGRQNFRQMDDGQLATALEGIYRRTADDFCDYQFYAFVALEGPGRELEARLGGTPEGREALQAIAVPYKVTRVASAHVDLLKLALARRPTDARLRRYLEQYAWLPMYEFIDEPYRLADVRRQAAHLANPRRELAEYYRGRAAMLRRYRSYVATVDDRRLKKLIEIVHRFSYLKEMRDDYRRPAYHFLRPFWEAVAARTGLTVPETNYLLVGELAEALRTGRRGFRRLIAARRQGYALELADGTLKVFSGRRAAAAVARKVATAALGGTVRGTTACPGEARGRARVIFHRGEFTKFKRGDVLVTTMTHPEFLPIMKQARAIVTDEGGITCHAAIVSRELGIPCVIGTRVATRVFSDGDDVAVDASRGTVRRL